MVRYNGIFIYNYSGRRRKLNILVNNIPHSIVFLYDKIGGQRVKATNFTKYDRN